MRRLVALGALLTLSVPAQAVAQDVQVGGFVGYSVVGGGDSRVVADNGITPVTGAGRNGLHLRAFVDVPLSESALTFRSELFYNRLTSGPNSFAGTRDGGSAQMARVDRSMGLTGSFVAATSRTANVAPYFSLGAGLFTTKLSYNPDPTAAEATEYQAGMGLGLVAGGGLRMRLGRPTLLVDWRYFQALNNTRGSAFMPLSVGLSF